MAALIGSGPMGGGGMWYRTLEREVHCRMDLLIYLAWYNKRHPTQGASEPDAEEEDTIRQQQAEARSLLRR